MRKNIFIILLIVSFTNAYSQEFNTIVFDEKANQEILIDYCNIEGFTTGTFNDWFQLEYDSYTTDNEILDQINFDSLENLEITIVLGTWCSDSRREFPRFYKILEKINFPFENLTIIAVNRNKEAFNTNVDAFNIQLVPTFIFIKDGKEIGRIIETPEISLEKDLKKILSNI